MICRYFVRLPLYVHEIGSSNDNQLVNTPHDLLVKLSYLYYGIKPHIVTLKKDREDIFSD